MTLSTKLVGLFLMGVALSVLSYHSLFVFLLPFLNPSHPFKHYFPSQHWARDAPLLLLIVALSAIALFFSKAIADKASKDKKK